MGYTHYWRNEGPTALWPTIVAKTTVDAKTIIEAAGVPIQRDYEDPRPAELGEGGIWLNGVGEDGHDTFVIAPKTTDSDFCKTARQPYDLVVCAILLRLIYWSDNSGTVTVSSDGGDPLTSTDGTWAEARELNAQLFG